MDRRLDPRSIVTPYAFAVHPDLLGQPLAAPWQRFGAIAVDLVVIALLSLFGLGPLVILSVALLFWLATRQQARDAFGKAFRIALGCLGLSIIATTALVVFLLNSETVQEIVDAVAEGDPVALEAAPADPGSAGGTPGSDPEVDSGGEVGFLDVVQGFRDARDLQQAENRNEALALVTDLAEQAYDAGVPRSEVRELLLELIPEEANWASDAEEILDEAIASLAGAVVPAPGGVGGGGDPGDPGGGASEAADALSPTALDSIEVLNRDLRQAVENQEDLERALARTNRVLEEERNRGVLDWVMNLIDELGIGFGWGALYLTIAHAAWKGTSIGKKLFRIRVVMIDKRPLNWWLSFERAGGYAAGFATGLLGFAQVFWDPNRQAIHDKVSETIVIQDNKDPVPGPWIEEGKAQWSRGRKTS